MLDSRPRALGQIADAAIAMWSDSVTVTEPIKANRIYSPVRPMRHALSAAMAVAACEHGP